MITPQFGGADLFEERDVERPRPGAGEVLVRVVAAGTNPVDAKLRANGTSADYHVAKADIVAKKPATISHEEAAAVPLAGGTAYEAIVRRLAVQVGETILIHGGAGGVGSFAVQIAKAAGARILATASSDNQDTLK